MAGISVDLINPFLMATTTIMKNICQTDMSIGKPYVKTTEFSEESVAIMIGITGQMKGQVLMAFGYEQALQVIHLVISSVNTVCRHVGRPHFLFHVNPPVFVVQNTTPLRTEDLPPGCHAIIVFPTIALFLTVVQMEYP